MASLLYSAGEDNLLRSHTHHIRDSRIYQDTKMVSARKFTVMN